MLVLAARLLPCAAAAVERFPPPDFTDHKLPVDRLVPPPRAEFYQYLDLAALSVGAWRWPRTWRIVQALAAGACSLLAIASLAWLGFWRGGCICPIGSIQNVALAVFDPSYALPWTVAVLFALPIVFTLFFGRTFCAAVCPLGAVQELVALRPVERAHLARPGAWGCWPMSTWGGRAVCRHRHGVRHLPLRSVRGLLPPQRAA